MTYPLITRVTNVIYTIGPMLVYLPEPYRALAKEIPRIEYMKQAYREYILAKHMKRRKHDKGI
jgi:hypothetical protein